jgi:polar amino acid transport system permease protein
MAAGEQEGLFERLSLASGRVPFRAKLAAVWVVIFLLLGWFFMLAGFDTGWMQDRFRFIVAGSVWTITIAVGSIILAVVLATIGAICRISKNPVLVGVSGFYTSFFRGTPLIVQLFLAYLALPQVAIGLQQQGIGGPRLVSLLTLNPFVAGILVLGLNYGAYMTEIFRAGIQAVPHGQWEAAQALGLRYGQVMRRVILPQAARIIIPPTGNEFIAMMKDTALVSFLGVTVELSEIFRRATLSGKADFKNLEALVLAAAMYWFLTSIFTYFQGRLERRMSRGYVRTAVKATAAGAQPQVTYMPGGGLNSNAGLIAMPAPDQIGTETGDHDALPPVPKRHPGSGPKTGPGT